MHPARIVRPFQKHFKCPLCRIRGSSFFTSRDTKRVLSPFLLSKRVFEHVFHAPHPHIRQKQDRTGLWTIFSLGARRATLSSDTTRGTPQLQYEHTSTANSSPQPEPC